MSDISSKLKAQSFRAILLIFFTLIILLCFTSLKVYDVLGHEVATLVNEQLKSGTYEVEWDVRLGGSSSELTSGVYFYTLKKENYSQTKKIILIK